jgi:hypothetical protein
VHRQGSPSCRAHAGRSRAAPHVPVQRARAPRAALCRAPADAPPQPLASDPARPGAVPASRRPRHASRG